MLEFKERVEDQIGKWLLERGMGEVDIPLEKPPLERFGELSTSLPFALAKRMHGTPGEIARDMASYLKPSGLIERIEAASPGYVNFYVNLEELAKRTIESALRGGVNYGRMKVGGGRKVQVEHTSVNPNKALHIGHARNVVLGVALSKLLAYVGYNLETISYIDDTGTQIADIILGFMHFDFDPEKAVEAFDQYCGDEVYVKVTGMLRDSLELMEKRSEIIGKIDEGGNEVAEFAKKIADRVLMRQLATCWRLGAEYDAIVWESDVLRSRLWEKAFQELKKTDLICYEAEGKLKGCWVVRLSRFPRYEAETDEVLIKSDGTTTYVAKDIANAMWKLGILPSPFKYNMYTTQPSGKTLWSTGREGEDRPFGSADLSINVIDVRQKRLQDVIKLVLSSLCGEEIGQRYIHYAYEVVSLSKGTAEEFLGIVPEEEFIHMSGRKGIYVNIDPALDMMKEVAIEESAKRNPDLPMDETWEIGERIALAALKYPLLAMDRDKIVIFDADKALDISEESGSYILYGYARAMRVLEKAGEMPHLEDLAPEMMVHDEEIGLLKGIAEFPSWVKEAAVSMNVKVLARYMYDLTILFNRFYERQPILRAEKEKRETRLLLVSAYTQTMRNLGHILAIPLVERM